MSNKHKTARWEAVRQTRRERRAADPKVRERREAHFRRVEADRALEQVRKAAEDREVRKAQRIAKAETKKQLAAMGVKA